MAIIIEEGREMTVNEHEVEMLIEQGIVYKCPECGDGVYHICDECRWDDMECFLSLMIEGRKD